MCVCVCVCVSVSVCDFACVVGMLDDEKIARFFFFALVHIPTTQHFQMQRKLALIVLFAAVAVQSDVISRGDGMNNFFTRREYMMHRRTVGQYCTDWRQCEGEETCDKLLKKCVIPTPYKRWSTVI